MNRVLKTVSVVAVGDIFLGEHPVTLNHGVNSVAKAKGCDAIFSAINQNIMSGDIVCGNLEGIISPKKPQEKGFKSKIYWGNPGCAAALRSAGFNCLFLANNHTAQHGRDALERTCRLLDRHKINWTGYNSADFSMPIPATFEVQGCRVAMLAYCETQQYQQDVPMLPMINYNIIKRQVLALKNESDIIIVSLHWGDEFIDYPSPGQIELAHSIIDLGVRLIVGHHSHTVQGIERYNHGLIAYSMGSFVKDLWPQKLRESVVLKCELSALGVGRYELTPVLINKYYQPEIYQGEKSERFLRRISQLSYRLKKYDPQKDAVRMNERYARDVKRLLLKDRAATFMHYLRYFFKYSPILLLENVSIIIMRRVFGKNI
jgi:poly-gamma-glutamate synthesis protein (capsule biosynthesis protein)